MNNRREVESEDLADYLQDIPLMSRQIEVLKALPKHHLQLRN